MNFDENSELIELRNVLQRERQLRMALEEKTRNLEAQLHPEIGYIRSINHVASNMSPPICTKDEKVYLLMLLKLKSIVNLWIYKL